MKFILKKFLLAGLFAMAFIGLNKTIFDIIYFLTGLQPNSFFYTYIFALGLLISPFIKGTPQNKWYENILNKIS